MTDKEEKIKKDPNKMIRNELQDEVLNCRIDIIETRKKIERLEDNISRQSLGNENDHILQKDGLNIDEILHEKEKEIIDLKQKRDEQLKSFEIKEQENVAKTLADFYNNKSQVKTLSDTDDFGIQFKKQLERFSDMTDLELVKLTLCLQVNYIFLELLEYKYSNTYKLVKPQKVLIEKLRIKLPSIVISVNKIQVDKINYDDQLVNKRKIDESNVGEKGKYYIMILTINVNTTFSKVKKLVCNTFLLNEDNQRICKYDSESDLCGVNQAVQDYFQSRNELPIQRIDFNQLLQKPQTNQLQNGFVHHAIRERAPIHTDQEANLFFKPNMTQSNKYPGLLMFAGYENKDEFDNIVQEHQIENVHDIKKHNQISPLNRYWHSPKTDETIQSFMFTFVGLLSIILIFVNYPTQINSELQLRNLNNNILNKTNRYNVFGYDNYNLNQMNIKKPDLIPKYLVNLQNDLKSQNQSLSTGITLRIKQQNYSFCTSPFGSDVNYYYHFLCKQHGNLETNIKRYENQEQEQQTFQDRMRNQQIYNTKILYYQTNNGICQRIEINYTNQLDQAFVTSDIKDLFNNLTTRSLANNQIYLRNIIADRSANFIQNADGSPDCVNNAINQNQEFITPLAFETSSHVQCQPDVVSEWYHLCSVTFNKNQIEYVSRINGLDQFSQNLMYQKIFNDDLKSADIILPVIQTNNDAYVNSIKISLNFGQRIGFNKAEVRNLTFENVDSWQFIVIMFCVKVILWTITMVRDISHKITAQLFSPQRNQFILDDNLDVQLQFTSSRNFAQYIQYIHKVLQPPQKVFSQSFKMVINTKAKFKLGVNLVITFLHILEMQIVIQSIEFVQHLQSLFDQFESSNPEFKTNICTSSIQQNRLICQLIGYGDLGIEGSGNIQYIKDELKFFFIDNVQDVSDLLHKQKMLQVVIIFFMCCKLIQSVPISTELNMVKQLYNDVFYLSFFVMVLEGLLQIIIQWNMMFKLFEIQQQDFSESKNIQVLMYWNLIQNNGQLDLLSSKAYGNSMTLQSLLKSMISILVYVFVIGWSFKRIQDINIQTDRIKATYVTLQDWLKSWRGNWDNWKPLNHEKYNKVDEDE